MWERQAGLSDQERYSCIVAGGCEETWKIACISGFYPFFSVAKHATELNYQLFITYYKTLWMGFK